MWSIQINFELRKHYSHLNFFWPFKKHERKKYKSDVSYTLVAFQIIRDIFWHVFFEWPLKEVQTQLKRTW